VGINYPDNIDTFAVPSLPEETSLSSSGLGNTRNHTELHDDINKAVVALETNAARKIHDHSGDTTDTSKGAKLSWANTHQTASASTTLTAAQALADTDDSPLAIHHTLGTGANQAAAGNHTHTFPQDYQIVSSVSAVPSPTPGKMVFETSTNMVKVWATYGGATGWNIVFGSPPIIPVINNNTYTTIVENPPVPQPAAICRLRQGIKQQLVHTGTILEWHEETEDPYNFFNPAASLTSIIIRQAGLYQIDCAVQWDAQLVPDVGKAVLCVNGKESAIRVQQTMKGNLQVPGFSQTLALSGKVRFAKDDVLTVKCSFDAPNNIIGAIFSFVEQIADAVINQNSKVQSRIDIVNVGA
jgi:hypothetical protein